MPNQDEQEMLARIDERVKHLERLVEELVTRIEFAPIKAIVFGLAFLILSAVVTALVASVVVK